MKIAAPRNLWYFAIATFVITAQLGTACRSTAGEKEKSRRRPNIILLMADDLGWGDVGFMGNRQIKTPNLDRLAGQGLTLLRFYAAAPVCSPTRASCLTGRHPARQGIDFANVGHLRREEVTLQQILKQFGYITGHFGKWHLGTLTTTVRDSNRGGPRNKKHFAPPWLRDFDVCFSTEAKVPTWDPMKDPKTGKYYGTAYWTQDGKKATTNLDGDDSRVIMDRVVPFVRNAAMRKQPFLAVVWFHTPHLPVVGGPKYLEQYQHVRSEKKRHYYAAITAMDEQIGRLWAELKRLGIADDTLVWFCSDNGPEGRAGSAPGSAGGLRGRKRSLLEGGIRVPAFVVWPSVIRAGRKSDVPICTSDYLPTIMQIVGAKMPDERPLDGVSVLPLLEGSKFRRTTPIAFQSRSQLCLVDGPYTLYSANNGKTWQLYDVTKDPGQNRDLAATMPKRVTAMRRIFHDWQVSVRASREGKDYPTKR